MEKKQLDDIAVENFRTYLRIPSVHPNVDYGTCLKFIEKLAKELGLETNVYRPIQNKPHIILTWTGSEANLPSILLNSHMDVVPVFEDKWSHKPFDADMDENGNIYARGAQDIKSLGIQYLEAIRRLKQNGFKPKRTVHVAFVSDEETGGLEGMMVFSKTTDFKKLNIGFALDEGNPSPDDSLLAFYGEKRSWKFFVHCTGQPGHGSLLLDNTAGEKIQYIIDKFYSFRAEEIKRLEESHNDDDITSVNLTILKGGVQSNVIPPEFIIGFDTRVPTQHFEKFERTVRKWCKDAGEGVTIEDVVKDDDVPHTKVDDSNPFWVALKKALQKMQGHRCEAKNFSREYGRSSF
ncbi:hypothetical protein FQA39_LY18599 [Lamprigera yunnana]|nr:hypothetical protein FQA39_LY18599 [Lamprigera yunnana]